MVKVEIRNLRKAFSSDSRTTAPIDGLSLEMPAGGITAVIGRSGCGKTTLLRLLAGLEKPDSGEIRMEDAQGRAAAPRTAVVFQALLRNRTRPSRSAMARPKGSSDNRVSI